MASVSQLIENLNNGSKDARLESLAVLTGKVKAGEIEPPRKGYDINNHIHTTYSFSPYSPSKAVWMAYMSGLATAGIMDHDSISGAEEFIGAGRITGVATTIGVECRADFSKTALCGRRINNPDQKSIAYIAFHGIPHNRIGDVKEYFSPLVRRRNNRNRVMADKIGNGIMKPFGISIDFDADVLPLSRFSEGGSVTERHISLSLSRKLLSAFGRGEALLNFVKSGLGAPVSPKMEKLLLDTDNRFYEFDLISLIKSELASSFYVDATDECPDVANALSYAKSIGAICAYPYLGDVGDSITGDKKSQKFEDDYLDLLFRTIRELGFDAVTYMPSRNTPAQLERLRKLCDEFGFFQISGEDINSPRQPFICNALRKPEYGNLIDSAWALIGHEKLATENPAKGMFSPETVGACPDLSERIMKYKAIGLGRTA